ncbi:MAG: flavin reductase family protein [Gemmatimonadetes bacterium]|nr:flavin reductase family protein [Gemmatimonadota bacterium]
MKPATVEAFREAMARFATGVTVVTARGADGADHGMTVSAFASLSLDPPLALVCVEQSATLLPHLRDAEWFGVSILAAGQEDVSRRFATKDVARFDGIATRRASEGPALIEGAVSHLVCRRVAEYPGGDHLIIVGEVRVAHVSGDEPLVHAQRLYGRFDPATR